MELIINAVRLTLLIGLFSTTAMGRYELPEDTPESNSNNKLEEEECTCTPYYNCMNYDHTGPHGEGSIDVRISLGPCQSYMEVCCNDTIDHIMQNHINSISDTKKDINHGTDSVVEDQIIEKNVHDNNNTTKNNYNENDKNSYGNNYNNKNENENENDKNSYGNNYNNNKNENDKNSYGNNYNNNKNENDKNSYGNNNNGNENNYDQNKENGIVKNRTCTCVDENSKYTTQSYDDNSSAGKITHSTFSYKDKEDTNTAIHGEPSTSNEKTSSETHASCSNATHVAHHVHNNATDSSYHGESKCGIWNKDGVGFKVVNAIDGESQYGEYPSMVAILIEEVSENGEVKLLYQCGGSLIKTNVVLTATHCINKCRNSTLVLRAGEWDLKTDKEIYQHQDRRVSKIVTHEGYYSAALFNDVALIFTDEPFVIQKHIQLVCLPEANDNYDDTLCYSSGWGKIVNHNNYTIIKKTEKGSSKEIGQYEVNILKKVELPIVPRDKCLKALRNTRLGPKFLLHESFICAGGVIDKDTCKGDGGSPLMCPSKKDPSCLVQVGIVAWGIACGLEHVPAVYVNVAGFRNWIDNEIEIYNKT